MYNLQLKQEGKEFYMNENNTNKFKIIKLILFLLAIALLVAITIKLFPLFAKLGSKEGQLRFKEEIASSGFSGVLMLVGLQLLQILVPVLPGEPIEFLAGMCYGTIGGMFIIFLGTFLSSFIIFNCVRKFGKNFLNTFFDKNKIEKLEKSKWFSNTEKIELILFIAFLIPGTPKDLFVYIAGLLPIRPHRFFLISTFCRFPSVISSTFAGSNVVEGNWCLSIASYIVTFAISGIGLYIYNIIKSKKNKRDTFKISY